MLIKELLQLAESPSIVIGKTYKLNLFNAGHNRIEEVSAKITDYIKTIGASPMVVFTVKGKSHKLGVKVFKSKIKVE